MYKCVKWYMYMYMEFLYGDYNALLNLQLETIFLILRILRYFYMYHVFLLWAS